MNVSSVSISVIDVLTFSLYAPMPASVAGREQE
jgi:hypothetical protein